MDKHSDAPSTHLQHATSRNPGAGVVGMVEGLLAFLNSRQGDRTEGMHALLVAFVQAAIQVIEDGDPEDAESNREALLTMLEQARRILTGAEPLASPAWTIH